MTVKYSLSQKGVPGAPGLTGAAGQDVRIVTLLLLLDK